MKELNSVIFEGVSISKLKKRNGKYEFVGKNDGVKARIVTPFYQCENPLNTHFKTIGSLAEDSKGLYILTDVVTWYAE